MKRLSVLVPLVLASALAFGGPFVGLRMDWGWPGVSFGYDFGVGQGYVVKYAPQLGGWWSFGFRGFLDLPYFENFQVGGGVRLSAHITNGWGLDAWHWGITVDASWTYRSARIFGGLYTWVAGNGVNGGAGTGPTASTWPFTGNVGIYFGLDLDLWKLATELAGKGGE